MKLLSKICLLSSLPIVTLSTIATTSSCSCGNEYKRNQPRKINGDDWYGHTNGSFIESDYDVDEQNETITYWNGQSIEGHDIIIPNYVVYNGKNFKVLIASQCFYECLRISGTIYLNDWTTEIPDECFYNDVNITKVVMTNYPTKIGQYAFFQCLSLKELVVNEDKNWSANVESIGNSAFESTGIEGNLFIPENTKFIGERAFANCINITSADMQFANQLKEIGQQCFSNCILLNSIKFPESITKISNGAFMYCSSLTEIILPKSEMNIELGDVVFYQCTAFEEFSQECTLEKIGDACFYGNVKLKFKPWEKGTKYIGEKAFASCDLKSFQLPDDFDAEVHLGAWSDNYELLSVDVSNLTEIPSNWIGNDFFANQQKAGEIIVPKEACEDPSATPLVIKQDWKAFFDKFGHSTWTFKVSND